MREEKIMLGDAKERIGIDARLGAHAVPIDFRLKEERENGLGFREADARDPRRSLRSGPNGNPQLPAPRDGAPEVERVNLRAVAKIRDLIGVGRRVASEIDPSPKPFDRLRIADIGVVGTVDKMRVRILPERREIGVEMPARPPIEPPLGVERDGIGTVLKEMMSEGSFPASRLTVESGPIGSAREERKKLHAILLRRMFRIDRVETRGIGTDHRGGLENLVRRKVR
jgi:hypothetical protein